MAAIAVSIVEANSAAQIAGKKQNHDWPVYGGTSQNNHFSPLSQINRKNVNQLSVAWTYDTEESGGLQSSPIVVDGVLYGLTPTEMAKAEKRISAEIKSARKRGEMTRFTGGTDDFR